MIDSKNNITNNILKDGPELSLSSIEFASSRSEQYSALTSSDTKKKLGQYFTPKEIAEYMASTISSYSGRDEIDILDPGAGMGILSCAVVDKIVSDFPNVTKVNLNLYELDADIINELNVVTKYLTKWAKNRGVIVNTSIFKKDFVLAHKSILNSKKFFEKYDLIISNPPYFKLSKNDERSVAVEKIVHGQPNIYSIFLAISANLLKTEGELVFITPRSFTSGKYFKKFREYFFSKISISYVHVFETRNRAFKKDNVLQETILLKAKRRMNGDSNVLLTYSKGITDLLKSKSFQCLESKMIDLDSSNKSLFLPTSDEDTALLDKFSEWEHNLSDLKLKASTGPVVFFRNLEYLSSKKSRNVAPLIWLNNVYTMDLVWPNKKFARQQFIKIKESSKHVLLERMNYVLIRRFSAKGDKKRLIACPLDKTAFAKYSKVGIENKLNYIHKINGELSSEEAVGLSALLTSSYYNRYFLMFNGNTNVSVTELNQMKFPTLKIISEIGKKLIENGFTEENIEKEVTPLFT